MRFECLHVWTCTKYDGAYLSSVGMFIMFNDLISYITSRPNDCLLKNECFAFMYSSLYSASQSYSCPVVSVMCREEARARASLQRLTVATAAAAGRTHTSVCLCVCRFKSHQMSYEEQTSPDWATAKSWALALWNTNTCLPHCLSPVPQPGCETSNSQGSLLFRSCSTLTRHKAHMFSKYYFLFGLNIFLCKESTKMQHVNLNQSQWI